MEWVPHLGVISDREPDAFAFADLVRAVEGLIISNASPVDAPVVFGHTSGESDRDGPIGLP